MYKRELCDLFRIALFYHIGRFLVRTSYITKNAPRDRTAADMKMLLKQPAAGGESRKRDSLFELAKKVYARNLQENVRFFIHCGRY